MPSALSETLNSSLSGLSAPRPPLAPTAVSGGFEDALRAADKPAPTPVAADRGTKPVKKDQDPPPSQAQDDSKDKKDKDQDSDTASATPAIPLVAVALAAPAAASATPAATETTEAVPAVGAKAAVPAPTIPATPQTNTPAPQEGDKAASFTQVLADAAAAKTAGTNAAAADSDATGTGTAGGTATSQTAAGGATANAAGTTTTGTADAAALANAGVSAVKGSLQPATADASKTDATAKTDAPTIPQAPAKPDATAAAKTEAKNDAAKVAVDATAAKKDAAADAAKTDKADDGQKLPTAPLPTADSGARTTQATSATPAAQTANPGQAQAQAPVPLAAVPNEIAARAAKGATKFDIRLDPADLGRIDVHIDIDSDGRVTSRLFVERSETLALLKNDSRQLERSLQQAGFQTDPGSLQFSLRDSGAGNTGGNAFARQNWTPPTPSQPAGRAGMPDETPRTALYRSSSPASSGLDIRI